MDIPKLKGKEHVLDNILTVLHRVKRKVQNQITETHKRMGKKKENIFIVNFYDVVSPETNIISFVHVSY